MFMSQRVACCRQFECSNVFHPLSRHGLSSCGAFTPSWVFAMFSSGSNFFWQPVPLRQIVIVMSRAASGSRDGRVCAYLQKLSRTHIQLLRRGHVLAWQMAMMLRPAAFLTRHMRNVNALNLFRSLTCGSCDGGVVMMLMMHKIPWYWKHQGKFVKNPGKYAAWKIWSQIVWIQPFARMTWKGQALPEASDTCKYSAHMVQNLSTMSSCWAYCGGMFFLINLTVVKILC